jgi:hypothetical protein
VQKILFGFYDGQLFRMVISYDGRRTEGMTADDMVEAISAAYGLAILPAMDLFAASPLTSAREAGPPHWEDSRYSLNLNYSDQVVARWEDSQYSLHLFRSGYLSTFGLVLFAKRPDALARAASVEGTRLDELEAPQREIERQQQQTEENRLKEENARRVNKATFRY